MTQLGEMVAIGVIKLEGSSCPFDHGNKEPPSVENNFSGSGSTLGTSLTSGVTTVTHAPNRRDAPSTSPYPTNPPLTSRPVSIDDHDYPVTCAAHHLIPAAGSLVKAAALLQWMEKSKGLWSNAGYDVNGAENGVWLPGNYAVGGNGTGEWTRAPSILPDDEHASAPALPPLPPPPLGSRLIHGYRQDFDKGRKGAYVLQATRLFNAQFHDSHTTYNSFVMETLEALGKKYQDRFPFAVGFCPDCKENAQKMKDLGRPTPFRVVHQLNSISLKMRGYLVGRRGHAEVFTSRWGMQAEDKGLSAIK